MLSAKIMINIDLRKLLRVFVVFWGCWRGEFGDVGIWL